MQNAPYKFENYTVADFPVYASSPLHRHHIVVAHYHRGAEIIKVIKGHVEVHAGTATYSLNEGEMIFFAPYVVHEVTSDTGNAAIRGFTFDPKVLGDVVDFNAVRDTHILFTVIHPMFDEVSQIFDELHRIYRAMPSTFRLRITAGLLLLVSVLTESNFLLQNEEGKKELRTAPAIRYIRENYAQTLSIGELASLVNLCNDTFIRIFKEEHGQTPFSYIMNFRITEALKLLSENKYSVSEIAAFTGFSSASYFTKVFREKLGLSPIKYKKEHFFAKK